MKFLLLLALMVISGAAAEFPFSKLPPGNEINILYTVSGDMFTATNRLKITHGNMVKCVLLWSIETVAGNQKSNAVPFEIELNKSDLERLDSALAGYRAGPRPKTSIREEITLVHRNGTGVVAEERIVDKSGSAFGRNILRLIRRVQLEQSFASRRTPKPGK